MAEIKTNKVNYIESKKTSLVGPIVFLSLVIVLSASLFGYNMYVKKQIDELKVKTDDLNRTADSINNKPEVQVYTLIDNNRSLINELEKRSKITTYIDHIDTLKTPEKYDINFEGFSISKGEIATIITAQSTIASSSQSGSLAYEKTIKFIKDYRQDPEALLNLNFVGLVEGMDNMKYNVTLSIK